MGGEGEKPEKGGGYIPLRGRYYERGAGQEGRGQGEIYLDFFCPWKKKEEREKSGREKKLKPRKSRERKAVKSLLKAGV